MASQAEGRQVSDEQTRKVQELVSAREHLMGFLKGEREGLNAHSIRMAVVEVDQTIARIAFPDEVGQPVELVH
jgi:hypothetical protein